jgi:hypothetical protein
MVLDMSLDDIGNSFPVISGFLFKYVQGSRSITDLVSRQDRFELYVIKMPKINNLDKFAKNACTKLMNDQKALDAGMIGCEFVSCQQERKTCTIDIILDLDPHNIRRKYGGVWWDVGTIHVPDNDKSVNLKSLTPVIKRVINNLGASVGKLVDVDVFHPTRTYRDGRKGYKDSISRVQITIDE